MKKLFRYSLIGVLVFLLVLIRAFEDVLFYDPFIAFYDNDYLYNSIPEYDTTKLFLHVAFRYVVNSIVSVAIVYLVFQKRSYLLLTAKLYGVIFLVLGFVYYFVLNNDFENGYLLPFYIRRFLIHPILLLLFLSALYYEKLLGSKKTEL